MATGFAGIDNPLFVDPKTGDALRRRQGVGAEAGRGRQGVCEPSASRSSAARTSSEALPAGARRSTPSATHSSRITRGEWTMPPKVYVTNYPAGDFRAMPALGGGHALLKWVTSFPGNPARGLPTVSGARAPLERGERASSRRSSTPAPSRPCAPAPPPFSPPRRLARDDASDGGGDRRRRQRACRRADVPRPRTGRLDLGSRRRAGPRASPTSSARRSPSSLEEALAADLVVTVTPGHEVLLGDGSLAPGQHVSLMGADGPGKAEIAAERARARTQRIVLRRLGAGEPRRRPRPCRRGRARRRART